MKILILEISLLLFVQTSFAEILRNECSPGAYKRLGAQIEAVALGQVKTNNSHFASYIFGKFFEQVGGFRCFAVVDTNNLIIIPDQETATYELSDNDFIFSVSVTRKKGQLTSVNFHLQDVDHLPPRSGVWD